MPSPRVIVVGAGLAGLRAAQVLSAEGASVLLLEGAERPGGRVATDVVDGYRIDRGFQLLNPAYPQARRALDLDALDLRAFDPGFAVVGEGSTTLFGDPLRKPSSALSSFIGLPGPLGSRIRLGWLLARLRFGSPSWLLEGEDAPFAEWVTAKGIDRSMVDEVLGPFMAGVLLDGSLESSGRMSGLLIRSFLRGSPSVPAEGMGAIPQQMAAGLDDGVLRLGCPVAEVAAKKVVAEDGEVHEADAVILATDRRATERLLGLSERLHRSCTTFWLSSAEPSALGAMLVAERPWAPIVNSVEMTAAAPSYAPEGRHLYAASSLSVPEEAGPEEVSALVAAAHGIDAAGLTLVARSEIPLALPAFEPPLDLEASISLGGILLAGDHVATPSIQGALASGERAARAALAGQP